MAELREKVSGIELAPPFVVQARVRTAFGQEDTITPETVPLILTMDSARVWSCSGYLSLFSLVSVD